MTKNPVNSIKSVQFQFFFFQITEVESAALYSVHVSSKTACRKLLKSTQNFQRRATVKLMTSYCLRATLIAVHLA